MRFSPLMPSPRPLAACAALLLAALSSLNAQSVATTPVGAITKAITVGLNSVGINLLNTDLVTAQCTSNTSTSLTLSGTSNIGALLTAGLPYYVEAVEGPLEGERFEVDTGATIAASNATIVIIANHANSTSSLTANVAANTRFTLRQHITLAQIQGFFTSPLVGNNSSSSADQIWFFDPAIGTFTQYFLRGDLVTWRQVGSTASANNVTVPPGVGIFIKKVNSAAQLTMTGGVRINNFVLPLKAGRYLAALPQPVSFSPNTLGATASLGWTGNNSAASADQLQIFNPTTGAFTQYFLRSDGTTWRQVGSTAPVSDVAFVAYDGAFMVQKQAPDSDYVVVSPLSL